MALDLVDRVPKELWTEVCDTVWEAVTKTIPKKKCKKAKWLSVEASQIAEKRRETQGKREKYTQLNTGFQRIERGDKAFLNEQYKEVKESNRMGKTRNIFKKLGCYQGNISCKDGHNKGKKW